MKKIIFWSLPLLTSATILVSVSCSKIENDSETVKVLSEPDDLNYGISETKFNLDSHYLTSFSLKEIDKNNETNIQNSFFDKVATSDFQWKPFFNLSSELIDELNINTDNFYYNDDMLYGGKPSYAYEIPGQWWINLDEVKNGKLERINNEKSDGHVPSGDHSTVMTVGDYGRGYREFLIHDFDKLEGIKTFNTYKDKTIKESKTELSVTKELSELYNFEYSGVRLKDEPYAAVVTAKYPYRHIYYSQWIKIRNEIFQGLKSEHKIYFSTNYYESIGMEYEFENLLYASNIPLNLIYQYLQKYNKNFFENNRLIFIPNFVSKVEDNKIWEPSEVTYEKGYNLIHFKQRELTADEKLKVGDNDLFTTNNFITINKYSDTYIYGVRNFFFSYDKD